MIWQLPLVNIDALILVYYELTIGFAYAIFKEKISFPNFSP
jgi:hypothetical protein